MKLEIINQKCLESLIYDSSQIHDEEIMDCDGGCTCDTGSDWVNNICPAPEWVVGWKKATC